MKYFRQLTIISVVSFAGEALNYLLPLPVPGSIYGLVLMLLGLVSRLIPLEYVSDTAHFLITIMPVMFLGPTVGLITCFDDYRYYIVPFFLICLLTTALVMGVTGRTTQAILHRKTTGEEEKEAGQNE